MKKDVLSNVIRFIDNISKSNHKIEVLQISFFGGEPILGFNSVCKPIMDGIEKLMINNKIDVQYHFTTNGYLINDEIIDYLDGKNVSFQITLDGFRDNHDKVRHSFSGEGSYDKIVSNVIELVKHGHNTILRINYTSDIIGDIPKIVSHVISWDLDNKDLLTIDMQRVWQDKHIELGRDEESIIADAIKNLNNSGINVSRPYYQHYASHPCYSDYTNQILINYNGDIFKCTARDFKKETRLGILTDSGKIEWDRERLELFNNSREKHKYCKNCRILPLCCGGCKQLNYELPDNGCNKGYSESDKEQYILKRFMNTYMQ